MKNIVILLACLFCFQACKDDEKEVNWTPDVLVVSSNETLEEAGDGHWKVTLPTEYKGAVKLEIQSDKGWEVEVTYMTGEDEKWITPSVEGGQGSASVLLAIADNRTAKDRKASVVITTKGDIPVKKTLTVIQGNVDEVLTVGTIDEGSFPEDITVIKNRDGSLALTLSKGFEGELNVLTFTGKVISPTVEIAYPDQEQKDWVTLAESPVAPVADSNVRTLSLTIGENPDNVYREAVVNLIATAGELTVKRSIEIIQFGVEEIVWNEVYYQQEHEFIVPATANEKLRVATCKNMNAKDVEVSCDKDWLTLTVNLEEGNVYAKVTAHESTNKERVSTITIKSKKTGKEVKMSVRQCMQGYGIILNKSLWKIAAYSNNVKNQVNDGSIKKMFNNEWSDKSNTNRHVQFDGGSDSDPYVFTFDLGENPRVYNYMGLMPRLQWTAPAPTTLKIEVSDHLDRDWETVVEKSKDNGFTKNELWYLNSEGTNNSNWYDAHYEGIVHWFKLSEEKIQKRYIRLSVYETLWGGPKYTLCMDEVFASDR